MDKLKKILEDLKAYRDFEKEKHTGPSGLNMAINELMAVVAEEQPKPLVNIMLDFIDEVTKYYCGDETVLSTNDRMNILNNSPVIVLLDMYTRQRALVSPTKRVTLHDTNNS